MGYIVILRIVVVILQHRSLSSGSLNIEDLEDVVKDQLHGRRESVSHISSEKVDKVR